MQSCGQFKMLPNKIMLQAVFIDRSTAGLRTFAEISTRAWDYKDWRNGHINVQWAICCDF